MTRNSVMIRDLFQLSFRMLSIAVGKKHEDASHTEPLWSGNESRQGVGLDCSLKTDPYSSISEGPSPKVPTAFQSQHHWLETKYSNTWACGGCFILKPHCETTPSWKMVHLMLQPPCLSNRKPMKTEAWWVLCVFFLRGKSSRSNNFRRKISVLERLAAELHPDLPNVEKDGKTQFEQFIKYPFS